MNGMFVCVCTSGVFILDGCVCALRGFLQGQYKDHKDRELGFILAKRSQKADPIKHDKTPVHQGGPQVAGCSTAHRTLVLHFSRWAKLKTEILRQIKVPQRWIPTFRVVPVTQLFTFN